MKQSSKHFTCAEKLEKHGLLSKKLYELYPEKFNKPIKESKNDR